MVWGTAPIASYYVGERHFLLDVLHTGSTKADVCNAHAYSGRGRKGEGRQGLRRPDKHAILVRETALQPLTC